MRSVRRNVDPQGAEGEAVSDWKLTDAEILAHRTFPATRTIADAAGRKALLWAAEHIQTFAPKPFTTAGICERASCAQFLREAAKP